MSRINISPQTRALIQTFAQSEGHNNLSAALSTIVHLGVPILLNRGVQDKVPAVWMPAPEPLMPNDQHPIPEDQPTDATIARLSLLLEEF